MNPGGLADEGVSPRSAAHVISYSQTVIDGFKRFTVDVICGIRTWKDWQRTEADADKPGEEDKKGFWVLKKKEY